MLSASKHHCRGATSKNTAVSASSISYVRPLIGYRSRRRPNEHRLAHPSTSPGTSKLARPADLAFAASVGDGAAGDVQSVPLLKRAAAIARKLAQQREDAAGVQPFGAALDESLTPLLASLLQVLADHSTASAHPPPNASTKNPDKPPSTPSSQTTDDLLQLLTQWADEFLVAGGEPPKPSQAPSSTPPDASTLARDLFMQLLTELLPPAETPTPPMASPGTPEGATIVPWSPGAAARRRQAAATAATTAGRGLLAATAAAFTAREAASRLQQRLQGDGVRGSSEGCAAPVDGTEGRTGDVDPAAWQETAKAATLAADAEPAPSRGPSSAAAAAAAVADDTASFCPHAWEEAAAAAAAALKKDEASPMQPSPLGRQDGTKPPLPPLCWAVSRLAQALTASRKAAASYTTRRAQQPAAAAHDQVPTAQQLLLLPAPTVVEKLLVLPAEDRVGLLLLLCGAAAPASMQAGGEEGAGAGCGSRGDAWLLLVLEGVVPVLGLLELGALLAAVYTRYGEQVFLSAATALLPLDDPRDASLSFSHTPAPPPAAALQALLLHWLLQPQLVAADLPVLPEALLLRLLPQLLAACSSRHISQAARWGSTWPLTQLQEHSAAGAPSSTAAAVVVESAAVMAASSSSSSSSKAKQLMEPQVEFAVLFDAWGGLTGVPLAWLAHVAAAAAARLVHGTTAGSLSSALHSQQLSQGTAAAACDAQAVLTALLRGLQPQEPLVLLLMQQVLRLEPGLAGIAAGSTAAEQAWKQQLLRLLLQAYSGTGLHVASLADCIHRSLWCMWPTGSGAQDISPQQQLVLVAAAELLAASTAEELQEELQVLKALLREGAKTHQQFAQHAAAVSSMLAALAEAADAVQAAAMLAVLPLPYWTDVWAVFVSPMSGSFCYSRQQLAATLRGFAPDAVGGLQALRAADLDRAQLLKKAWQVVAAHFNLHEVVQEVATRPTVPPAVSSTAAQGTTWSAPQQQQDGIAEAFAMSPPYVYKPGVPFIGDGWDQADDLSPELQPSSSTRCFAGSHGVFVVEVLSDASLPRAAAHIVALLQALPAQAFARVAAVLVPRLVSALQDVQQPSTPTLTGLNPQGSGSGHSLGPKPSAARMCWLCLSLKALYAKLPELPDAPYTLQLLAAAAPGLPLFELPFFITEAADLIQQLRHMPGLEGANGTSSNTLGSAPEQTAVQQLKLLVAAAAIGRDSSALQHLLDMSVRQLGLREAYVTFRVLQRIGITQPNQQLPYADIKKASAVLRQRCDAATVLWQHCDAAAQAAPGSSTANSSSGSSAAPAADVVWQMGQSGAAASLPAGADQALGSYVQAWGSSPGGTDAPSAAAAAAAAADKALVTRLSGMVADLPAAPPQGSWPMDAMHSPSYVAPLLKRLLALLADWVPSSPSAAAAAAHQLHILASKRQWDAAETAAFLQRLPLATALQLLLEAGSNKLGRMRPKLLAALVDWQGGEAVTQAIRELLVGYSGQGLTSFADLLSDLRPAFSGPSAGPGSSSSSRVGAPSAYAKAVHEVFSVLLPAGRVVGSWPWDLAQVLVQVSLKVPEAAAARLAEQVAHSIVKPQQKPTAASTASCAAWQSDIGALLAALPAADASAVGQEPQPWVALAAAVTAAVAESAGSTAVLNCIRAAFRHAVLIQDEAPTHAPLAAGLPHILAGLQQQGLFTCGVAYSSAPGLSTGGSSSMADRFSSRTGSAAPSCISMQLLQLLQDLYQHNRTLRGGLQQTAACILAVQGSLGKALPMAVANILGGGCVRGAVGYGASGPDAAEAVSALELATAEVTDRFQPTTAALPAATTAAAQQLAEALARCHELLPDAVMADLMAALAAVLPWAAEPSSATAAGSSGDGSHSGSSGTTSCPAEMELAQGGWTGVTQVLLITSSLVTGSCRVWGVDKGTQVAASLIQKLVAAAAAGGALSAGVAAPAQERAASAGAAQSGLTRSRSAGVLGGQEQPRKVTRRSLSAGQLPALAASAAPADGASSSSSSSASHAHRAEVALYQAAAAADTSSASGHQAAKAGGKLRAAAATGGAPAAGSHAQQASSALLAASDANTDDSSSSSSHAGLAEGKLLQAAVTTGGEAAPGSHAAKAKAALLQAASTGLSGSTDSSSGAQSHSATAHRALLGALSTGATSSDTTPDNQPASAAADEPDQVAWATAQLQSAADAWLWPGLTTAAGLVKGILYPKYHSPGQQPAAAGRGSSTQDALLSPCDAAAALAAALPGLAPGLPEELTAEVLGHTWTLLPSNTWEQLLCETVGARAPGAGGWDTASGALQLEQLCARIAASLQQLLEPSEALPAAYAQLLTAVASQLPENTMARLLQRVLVGPLDDAETFLFGDAAVVSAVSVPQLLLELSRTRSSQGSSSNAAQHLPDLAAITATVVLMDASESISAVTSSSSSSSSSVAADGAGHLARQLDQPDLLPLTYLMLLRVPHVSAAQLKSRVRALRLSSPDNAAALGALERLCNTLNPGRQIPLGSYARVLAAALDDSVSQRFDRISNPERRQGLEMDRQITLGQLLGGTVWVLGTFRGMRRLLASPLGAQLVLPLHDLAAVLCFCWELLPAADASALAASVAAALERLPGQKLELLLQLLPSAAAEGFRKGPELWQPLLHTMAVAGGMSAAQEQDLTQTLMEVKVSAGVVESHPLVDTGDGGAAAPVAGATGGFADPAAVSAALAPAADVNQVGLAPGRVSRSSAAGRESATAAGSAAAEVVAEGDAGGSRGGQSSDAAGAGAGGADVADEGLSGADVALLTAAAAAYVCAGLTGLCAAMTGVTPIVMSMGAVSTLLAAAVDATLAQDKTTSNTATQPTTLPGTDAKPTTTTATTTTTTTSSSSSSGGSSSSSSSPPPSPRPPTVSEAISRKAPRGHMGGRTKVTFAEPAAAADGSDTASAAAALGYAAATAAAAAAAASQGAGVLGLGSLAVDPDDVIKKIKSQSAALPLDEALMELVPLLLLPAASSSYTWPLLGLSAVLHSKLPRLHTLLGPGGSTLINRALAATLLQPDGPLAAVMRASELLADPGPAASAASYSTSSSSSSAEGVSSSDLRGALAAAEAVHPHAVAMQLAERLLDALWVTLRGSVASSGARAAAEQDTNIDGAAGATAVSTPEGAAAAWQQLATALLAGTRTDVAAKLLQGVAHRQQGNWEAQLRLLAVAATLQQQSSTSSCCGSHNSSGARLLPELLTQVTASHKPPLVSFLVVLLNSAYVPLDKSDATAILQEALTQLMAKYGTQLPVANHGSTAIAAEVDSRIDDSSSGGGSWSWDGPGASGQFDSWAMDALSSSSILFRGSGLSGAQQGLDSVSSSSSGPQYQATSGYANAQSDNGSSRTTAGINAFMPRTKLPVVPGYGISQVKSLVEGACDRGHADAALNFIVKLLQVAYPASALAAGPVDGVGLPAGPVLLLEAAEQQALLHCVVLAVDRSVTTGSEVPSETKSVLAQLLPELVAVLGERGHLQCINKVVALVCGRQALLAASRRNAGATTAGDTVTPELVGRVLTMAAEGVRKSEGGVLSSAKLGGAEFLSCAADALLGVGGLSVQQCLVLLAAVAPHLPQRLGLQLVAAAAKKLHSVMPQAVDVVREAGRVGGE